MKAVLEHLKYQTVPHDMMEELQGAGIKFYENCLIVQVKDYRTTGTSTPSDIAKEDTQIPFSIHNHSKFLTPSPYVPYRKQDDEDGAADGNSSESNTQTETGSASGTSVKDMQSGTAKGPQTFTVVLFPTPLSLQEEVYIQANTPDPRPGNRKQSTNVPRTPASATIPPTPLSAVPSTPSLSGPPTKKQKMTISGQEIHDYESKIITSTAPPLFLDPVDNLEDAQKLLSNLTDSQHQEPYPAPKTRKRTVAELAADEAIAAQDKAFMLIMDERLSHTSGTTGTKTANADSEATAPFEPRFETWQAIKNIRAEHKERAEREAEAKALRDAQAAANKANQEQQERERRMALEHRAQMIAQEQQQVLALKHQKERQAREMTRQAMAAGQAQLAHGHPPNGMMMSNGLSQPQHSSPIVRNMTPHNHSSPMMGHPGQGLPMNVTSSGNTSSPARPPSAMQHGHPAGGVSMVQQRSRQQAPSRTGTPQMNGTPQMGNSTPMIGHATPRMTQGSPPPIASTPVMNHNVMANQHLNAGQQQFTPQHVEMMRRQQQHQQMINAQHQQQLQNSPNMQMSPDRNPAQLNLQQYAAHNQQRLQEAYGQSLSNHHRMMNGVAHPSMPNGASPPQQPHPQQHPQQPLPQQRTLNPLQQQQIQNAQKSAYQQVMTNLVQKYGTPANIPQQELDNARQQAMIIARTFLQRRSAQAQQQRQNQQNQVMQAHMQAMGHGGMNGQGMGGQMMREMSAQEQQRQQAIMAQMTQMPHLGGGGMHNAHLNGGGIGGMQ